ncbi:MAG: TatD family hydrolase [Rhodospirillales bacterium]
MLVDSHCHLDFPEFAPELDAVVARAEAAGVRAMLTISTDLSRFERVLAIAERFANVYCTVGVHPHEAASEGTVTVEALTRLAEHPKVIGFGETGLDYYYEHSPGQAQQRSFRVHLAAARAAGLPVVIHTRDADDDTASMLVAEHAVGPFPGVIHCFSSTLALARQAVGLGLYISFSGIVTFKKADGLREVAAAVPLERLLVETDAPFLAPGPKRGKRNEPAFVVHTAAAVARVRGMDEGALARATSENFFRLFAKAGADARAEA